MFKSLFFAFSKKLIEKQTPWLWLEHQKKFEPEIRAISLDPSWIQTGCSSEQILYVAPDGQQAKSLSKSTSKTILNLHRVNHNYIKEYSIKMIVVLNANTLKIGSASILFRLKTPILMISNREEGVNSGHFLATETPDNKSEAAEEFVFPIPAGEAVLTVKGENEITISLSDKTNFLHRMEKAGASHSVLEKIRLLPELKPIQFSHKI